MLLSIKKLVKIGFLWPLDEMAAVGTNILQNMEDCNKAGTNLLEVLCASWEYQKPSNDRVEDICKSIAYTC